MKSTFVGIIPPEAAKAAGRPALTPELLAASGARYSRSNDGLEAILGKIDWDDLNKSVDGIFRFVDFGHQSIADMTPIAIFIDGLTMYLVYRLWAYCQVVAGQESSTRYIKMSLDGVAPANQIGLPPHLVDDYQEFNLKSFDMYNTALAIFEQQKDRDPSVMRIPKSLLDDPSDKAQKQVARMSANYALDRARYSLPSGCLTNVMMIMSGRDWAKLTRYLASHFLPEARSLAEQLMGELELVVPRLMKHTTSTRATAAGIHDEFEEILRAAEALGDNLSGLTEVDPLPYLHTWTPPGVTGKELAKALAHFENRYEWVGSAVRRTGVRYGANVSFAEIRDFNRHRTGSKYCPELPLGFYYAADQCTDEDASQAIQIVRDFGFERTRRAARMLANGDPYYVYFLNLGCQFAFEHTTTADKWAYTAGLRTFPGAHYRYADHFRVMVDQWYQTFPETQGLIHVGQAEPE